MGQERKKSGMKIKKQRKEQCAGTTEFVFALRCRGLGWMWLMQVVEEGGS